MAQVNALSLPLFALQRCSVCCQSTGESSSWKKKADIKELFRSRVLQKSSDTISYSSSRDIWQGLETSQAILSSICICTMANKIASVRAVF